MTVIAWDGKTLAADKLAQSGDTKETTTKIFKMNDGSVAATCGTLEQGLLLIDWYRKGADSKKWPEFQKDKEDWSHLVIAKDGKCWWYSQLCVAVPVEDNFKAWGVGREFALGAMANGATAREAVIGAGQYIAGCGRGVDSLSVEIELVDVDKLNPLMVKDNLPTLIKNVEIIKDMMKFDLISKENGRQLISNAIHRYEIGIPT